MNGHLRWASLLALAGFLSFASRVAADDVPDGFESLFDGETLKDWDGNPKFWSVRDGTITGQTTDQNPTPGNTFLIWRGGEVEDFELHLEYRIQGGNSGVQYRSFEVPNEKWVVGGYQADFEAGDTYSGILYGERFRGILANRGQKTVIGEGGKVQVVGSVGVSEEIQAKIKRNDWNSYYVRAVGNHMVHKINGMVTCEATDEDSARRSKGILALQLHAGPPMTVQFRKIHVRSLKPAENPNAAKKKIQFIAGVRSHGYGAHEHYAGCMILANALRERMPQLQVEVIRDGWPSDPSALDDADCLVMYADGGGGHPVNAHLEQVDKLAARGVGIVCLHYGVEVPKGESGDHFLKWIGGYFETDWSVNPHWTADFKQLPDHPITRGVKPFQINDEWYYHMRFRPQMEGVTPILSDLPPDESLTRPDGPHSGNPNVRAAVLQRKERQHVAWAAERPDGGRGFGFTGGHVHWNWGDPNFRKIVLNAIVWAARAEVPENGVQDEPVTLEQLEANQDYERPADFDREAIRKSLNLPDPKAPKEKQATPNSGAAQEPTRGPQDALGGLDVGEGLQAALFAAEPLVLNPTDIDVDHRGRVWACEVINYRRFRNGDKPERSEGDRIVILEDTDGDGQADQQKTFYQGRDIDSAHGICVLGSSSGKGTKAIVSAGEHVLLLTDTDGDDQADDKQVLFSGIGGVQHDHGIHAFVFGPDGKLYFNFGNEGKQLKDAQGNPVVDGAGNVVAEHRQPYQQGMVFRCNLDGSDVETLGWNFRNNWEVAVDSFGTLWQSDNDDDGNRGVRINYVMEFGNYGYLDELTGAGWQVEYTGMPADVPLRHWHLTDPGVVPNLLQTGAGSPTGICVYEGDLLPAVFRNQMIHADAGPNVVRAYPVTDDGAGYQGTTVNVLHGARDNWFRPSDVCVAPDGSLLIADWYDPGVGGHRMEDVDRGRIFRVAPSLGAYQVPPLDVATPEGAVQALRSPNLATRYLAWTALHRAGAKAEPVLTAMYSDKNPRYRARALWLLGKMEGRGADWVRRAIGDPDANLRVTGVRLARQLKLDLIPIVRQLVTDRSPQVRRELAIALRHHPSPAAPGLWAQLAAQHDGKDRWYLEALGIGADRQWDAYFAAWLKEAGKGWDTPAGRDIIWRSRAPAACEYLAEILKDESTPEDQKARYFRAFDFHTGPEKERTLKSLLDL